MLAAFLCLYLSNAIAAQQSTPAAIYTDPPADATHPAAMTVLHIPSHGISINGIVYQPAGVGPHPTLVICHGLPGNEKNLDLAQAVRRAGWNAVTFNYRGSWGSPGRFSFAQNLEDAASVLRYLRDPANASRLGVDPERIVIAGHSMGGWVAALTAAHDQALKGLILISAADMGAIGAQSRADVIASMAGDMESLQGVTPESMADEVITHSREFGLGNAVNGLVAMPMLVLSANDGLAPQTDALVKEIQGKGGKAVQSIRAATDHSWSDHRIFLEATVITWLNQLN